MAVEVNPVEVFKRFVADCGTQQDAAKRLGVSGVYVSDMLRGRRTISARILKKLGLKITVVQR